MTGIDDALVLVVAFFFLGMGVLALARPERIVRLFGTTSLTREGRNEVRAVYGGFGVAVALVLIATQGRPELSGGVRLAVALALIGMASGRLVSVTLERGAGRIPWLFFLIELLLAGILLMALRSPH